MTAVPVHTERRRRVRDHAGLGAAIVAAAGAAAVAAPVLARHPPSPVLVAGVIGVAALLMLAVSRFDAVVALGFLLLGVVKVEPAPTDALLAIAIALSIARLDLRRVPGPMQLTLVALLAVNLLSATGALDLGDSLRFFAITLYLAVFAIWLTA